MEELQNRVKKNSRNNPTNVFLGYSGHGTSISGKLCLTLPTKLTQEEYIDKFEDLLIPVDNLPVEEKDLKRFRELREQIGKSFLENTFAVSERLKNEEVKNEMKELIGKF